MRKKIIAAVTLYFTLFATGPMYSQFVARAAIRGRPLTLAVLWGHTRMAISHATGGAMFAPVTHYYRLDGGSVAYPGFDSNQCDGLADVAMTNPALVNQHCAAKSPMSFVSYNQGWIAGTNPNGINMGDTIANTDGGTFAIGQKLPGGPGIDWTGIIQACGGGGYTPNCILPTLLDGITITGSCASPCHSANGLNLNPTTTWMGVNGAFWMVDVEGTTGVTLRGLRLTSAESCQFAMGPAQCNKGVSNYGQHGINLNYLNNKGPDALTVTDVQVDNMAGQGALGGYFGISASSVSNFSFLFLKANATAGWDWDGGNCGNDACGSVGTVNATSIVVDWSGCNLAVPMDTFRPSDGFPTHGVNNCQGQTNNGYGDGFAVGVCEGTSTTAFTLNIHFGHFRYNVQDGLDPLHEGDCPTTNPSTIIIGNESIGNAGQIYKLGAGNSQTLIGNFGVGNCLIWTEPTVFPMNLNPPGYASNFSRGDMCRANDVLAFVLKNGATYDVESNTIMGYNQVGIDIGCYAGASPVTNCTTGTKIIYRNNLFIAYPLPDSGVFAAGIFFNGIPSIFGNAGSAIDHNGWWNAKNGCPQDPAETAAQCGNPLLVNQVIDTADIHLTALSPERGTGVTSSVTTDFFETLYGNPRSIGAAEFGSAPPPPTPSGNVNLHMRIGGAARVNR